MPVDIDELMGQLGLSTSVLDNLSPQEQQQDMPSAPSLDDLTDMMAETTIGCRVSVTRFGASKSFDKEQRRRAAEPFGADPNRARASKVLVDTKNDHYKAVVTVIREAKHFWRMITADYDEDGIRLLRKTKAKRFVEIMEDYKLELEAAKRNLAEHEEELRHEAADMLGELYNPMDYPASIANEFTLLYDFPNLKPNPDLAKIGQELFENQLALHKAKLQESVQNTVNMFTGELYEMISHLSERLTPGEDGKQKVFHKSTLDNLKEFFQSFKDVAEGINPDLDSLFAASEQVLEGVTPDKLRKDALVAGEVRSNLHAVMSKLDSMLVDAPSRGIVLD